MMNKIGALSMFSEAGARILLPIFRTLTGLQGFATHLCQDKLQLKVHQETQSFVLQTYRKMRQTIEVQLL